MTKIATTGNDHHTTIAYHTDGEEATSSGEEEASVINSDKLRITRTKFEPYTMKKFEKIMRGTQGALIVASILQIVVGFSGLWRNVVRFLSPLSAVPLVALSGFGLYELGFPLVAKCVEIGLPQLIILVIFSQYIPHLMKGEKHIFDRFAVIFSVIIVWIYAHLLTVGGAYKHAASQTQTSCRTDRAGIIGAAPWQLILLSNSASEIP